MKKASGVALVATWFGAAVSVAEIEAGIHSGGNVPALVLGHVLGGMLLFAAGLIGAKTNHNAMETASDAFGTWGGRFFAALNVLQLVGLTAVIVAFSTVTTTFLDAHSSGESVKAIFAKASPQAVGVIVCDLGAVLAIRGIVDRYVDFLYLIASVFAPMAAVLIMSHHFAQRSILSCGRISPKCAIFASWAHSTATALKFAVFADPRSTVTCPSSLPAAPATNSPADATPHHLVGRGLRPRRPRHPVGGDHRAPRAPVRRSGQALRRSADTDFFRAQRAGIK